MVTLNDVRVPGDPVADPAEWLKGFNTFVTAAPAATHAADDDGTHQRTFGATGAAGSPDAPQLAPGAPCIVSAACGVVDAVERVVSVRGASARYVAEVGDVVVGRVTDVLAGKWLIDIGAAQKAVMMLSNVTEPGGMLRRRGREDELTMRRLFTEGDLVAAEVQRVTPDGLVNLHTRSATKYGRLTGPDACLVQLQPSLMQRVKHHYHTFKFGITAILGVNGGCWVMRTTKETVESTADQCGPADERDPDAAPTEGATDGFIEDPAEARLAVARTRNCLLALSQAGVGIDPDTVAAAVAASTSRGLKPFDILLDGNSAAIARAAVATVGARKRGRPQH